MKGTICVDIFKRKSVVVFMGKEANNSPTAEWSCSFPQCHCRTADLPALLAHKNILDRGDLYLYGRLSILLELQRIVLNRQGSAGVARSAFKPKQVGSTNTRWCIRIRWLAGILCHR